MSAVEKIFLDTNVLVYAHDRAELVKGPQASSLLARLFASGQPTISIQVLSECFWAITRKIKQPFSNQDAGIEIARLNAAMRVVPLTWGLFEKALQSVHDHHFPWWDALIFAAAKQDSATTLLSEDFQNQRIVEGITFLNPFAPDFDLSALLKD